MMTITLASKTIIILLVRPESLLHSSPEELSEHFKEAIIMMGPNPPFDHPPIPHSCQVGTIKRALDLVEVSALHLGHYYSRQEQVV